MVHALPISDAAAGLSVSQALALAGQGIQAATGGPTWVYGEVDGMVRSRAGHLYWCLVDGEARLSVVAFRSGAVRMTATLTRAGIELADGMAIRVFGDLMVYAQRPGAAAGSGDRSGGECRPTGSGATGHSGEVGQGRPFGRSEGAANADGASEAGGGGAGRTRAGRPAGSSGSHAVGLASMGGQYPIRGGRRAAGHRRCPRGAQRM